MAMGYLDKSDKPGKKKGGAKGSKMPMYPAATTEKGHGKKGCPPAKK